MDGRVASQVLHSVGRIERRSLRGGARRAEIVEWHFPDAEVVYECPLLLGPGSYVCPNSVYLKSKLSNYRVANFRGLFLGCVDAELYEQILVEKLLTRSIRFTFLCTSPT